MISLIVALMPMGIIGGGLYWAVKKNAVFENYKHTQGKIIAINKKKLNDYSLEAKKSQYYPLIEYYDENGVSHTYEYKIGSERYPDVIDKKVDLLFNPNHPNDVIVDSFLSKWIGPVVVCSLGLLILIILIIVTSINLINEKKQDKL
jgi:hypothetical protein